MHRRFLRIVPVLLAVLALPSLATAQSGIYLPGAGSTHAGMAGASTATPLDALGALYWNPAAIGRLGRNEVAIGGAFVYPDIFVSSSRPQLNGQVLSGRTRSDNGFPLVPSLGVVTKLDPESPFTFGFGMVALGGGGVNFPGDANNPILSPTGPLNQFVLGPVFSNVQLLQMNPTVSYQVTDRLVVGVGPTVDIAMVSMDPAYFATPNVTAGQLNTFSSATNSRPFWGGGFRAGLVYSVTESLDVGFGYTSEQWLETWRFNARDNAGNARSLSLKASLPAIYSVGVAWRGIERLTLAADLRYFDYANTDLYGTPVVQSGLGWDNTLAVSIGGDYQVTDRIAIRAGYQYNECPLRNTSTLFNIQSPAIIQNTVSVGTTVSLTEALSFGLGYAYGFENTITGTATQVPNASITLGAASHALLFNLQVKFGGEWNKNAGCGSTYETNTSATAQIPAESPSSNLPAQR